MQDLPPELWPIIEQLPANTSDAEMHSRLSEICLSRCDGDAKAADELYKLLIDHLDAEIEIANDRQSPQ